MKDRWVGQVKWKKNSYHFTVGGTEMIKWWEGRVQVGVFIGKGMRRFRSFQYF